jgi:hypothetical protein
VLNLKKARSPIPRVARLLLTFVSTMLVKVILSARGTAMMGAKVRIAVRVMAGLRPIPKKLVKLRVRESGWLERSNFLRVFVF